VKNRFCLFAASCCLLFSIPAFAQTIPVVELSAAPQIDGNAAEWQAYPAVDIPLTGELAVKNVSIKAGFVGDEVFLLLQWQDTTHDAVHRPYAWNNAKGKYKETNQHEDRLAMNFAMEGDFTSDWLSGKTFKADMWHSKAARTNPIGLSQDKLTIITTEKSKKAYKATAANGKEIYILRPSDSGDPIYTTARYATKEKDVMPKYILHKDTKGSIADVKAMGVWKDGQWTLELKRKRNTDHSDDVVFTKGTVVPASVALFDRSIDEHHNISGTFNFQF